VVKTVKRRMRCPVRIKKNFISLYPIFKLMHPYANYPLRFRRFFNNFMMSKTGNDTIDGMNWARDVKLYKIEDVVEKAGLQLPSFSMAKEVFEKYGYAPESSEEEVEKAADEAFRLGYDTGRTVAEEAANHPDIETPEEAYANFEEAYVTSSDYTQFVLPELRRLAKCGDLGSGSFPVCSEESLSRYHILVNRFWQGVYAGIKDHFKKLPVVKRKPFTGRPKCPVCGLPASKSYTTKEGEIFICPKGHKFKVEE